MPPDPDLDSADPGVPIAEVSRLLGVPMPTLRSWESRYSIPGTPRVAGRHRRYQPAELHALRLMRDHIARGERAGAAARSVRALLGAGGPATGYVEALLAAAEASDLGGVRRQLELATEALGLGSCLDDVLFPAMHQIGSWWHAGRCDIDQERLTTEVVRVWLDRETTLAPAPDPSRATVVLAGGPSDLHTVGLEALGLLLRHRSRGCRLLGGRTSTLALTAALKATGAGAVVIVSQLATSRRRAVESIRVAGDLGVMAFYAGNAFTTEQSRRGVPGRYLGVRLQDACAVVDSELIAHD